MALINTIELATLPQSSNNYDPIPEGWYEASITKADLTPTKDGNGQYIKLRLDVTGPAHQGRVVFSNLNIRNASQKAEEIGRQQLGDIMRAIGLSKVSDTDQLIGGNVKIKVAIRQSEQYGAQNEVKAYAAASGVAPAVSSAKPVAQATAGSAPPWAKK